MTADREDFIKRYAAMSDEEFATIKREDLVEAARECYDQEILRRSASAVPVVADMVPPPPEQYRCPKCKTLVQPDELRCPECGGLFRTGVEAGLRQWLPLSTGIWLAFALLLAVGYFAFEGVAVWLGIICFWGGGEALTLKIALDQERSAGLWAAIAFVLGPVAALLLLASSPKLNMLRKVLVIALPLALAPLLIMALEALTGQGAFRVVKTGEVSAGYSGTGENFCGKFVNVEGKVTAIGSQVTVFPLDRQSDAFAVSDESGGAANIIGNAKYPRPRVGDRVRVGAAVRCETIAPAPFRLDAYTLMEVSRRSIE